MEVPEHLLKDATYHENFFSELLDRIPQHLILPPTEKEEEETAAARFYKHRKLATPVDEKRKVAVEGKKARFDPDNQLTISERQKERESSSKKTDDDDNKGGSDDDESDSENEEGFVDDVDDEEVEERMKKNAKGKVLKQKKQKNGKKGNSDDASRKSNEAPERHSINVLREKLAKRIIEFRSSRNLKEAGSGKPRHDRNSKPQNSKSERTNLPSSGNKRKGNFSQDDVNLQPKLMKKLEEPIISSKDMAVLALKKDKAEKVKKAAEEARKKVEESSDIQFTMLHVLDKSRKHEKTPAPGSKVARMKSLLMRAEEKEKKVEFLKSQGQQGLDQVMAQNWKDTLKMATGEKVLEDKTKLKKALKRREQAKKKSAKKWDQITKDLEDAKNTKQDKRETNLRNRSNNGYPIPVSDATEGGGEKGGVGNGDKKRKNGSSKGLNGAGFEGKKKGFLNKS